MAGQYSYDPRPFYNGNYGLMPLDEVFYGRSESMPYWMDQRMMPMSAFDDYYTGHKQQMAMGRQLQQQYTSKRPETSRDDISMDMYRRSPYNFQGALAYGAQPRPMSQDDTWVRPLNHPQLGHGNNNIMMNDQYRRMPDQGYMPISHNMHGPIKTNNMTMGGNQGSHGSHGNQGNQGNYGSHGNQGNHGSQGNSKMSGSSDQFGTNSNGYGNQGSNKMSGSSNNSNGYGNQGNNKMSGPGNQFGNNNNNGYENTKSLSQGTKSMKQGSNMKQQQQRRQYDSSSEDSDDEYENGSKWAMKNSQVKHGNNMHQSVTHLKSGNSKGSGGGNNNYGSSYNSNSTLSKKSSGGLKKQRSLISKLLRFQDDNSSSSDSDNEGYGHNNTKKSSSKMSNHGHQQQQNKPMQYGSSQCKGVELKVPLCCNSCEQKVKECLEYMDGVESVLCDQWSRKVIVYGNVKPENVLKRVRKVKKTAELWQQLKPQQMRVY